MRAIQNNIEGKEYRKIKDPFLKKILKDMKNAMTPCLAKATLRGKTTIQNLARFYVMGKIGMHHDPKDDFDHHKLPEIHPLKKHILYRLTHQTWSRQTGSLVQ